MAKPGPTPRGRQDVDLRLQRPGALTTYRAENDKATPSGREEEGGGGGAKMPGPNTDWWRRKIRQGMMQTEMLMSELVRQRRADEKYYHGINPYIYVSTVDKIR